MTPPVRVLIVDDEEQVRRNFRAYLEDSGYCVLGAASGQQGMDVFQSQPVDIVLTDLGIGEMNGMSLIAAIKDKSPDTPVVVVSGTGGLQDAIESIRRGAWDYIVKPLAHANELDVIIRRNLDRARLLVENRRHREHLEELVEQRTRQLSQTQEMFLQAQKMEAVGRLAAGVAHDFNNQLTVVQGYCDILLGGRCEGDPLWEPLTQIRLAAKRAASTASHLLSFSRKQVLEPQVVDLQEFLQEAEKPISRVIGDDIKLIVATEPGVSPVFIDRSGLHQALVNLVVNARDAMLWGGELVLRTSNFHWAAADAAEFPEAPAGDYVLLEVIDSGTGMDRQTLTRVFEPFFTTKGPGKGTGLGLPMVMGFIRQSGGFLGIQSEPGKGTAVRLLLPLCRGKVEADATRPASPSVGKHQTATILVVEDEDGVRNLVASTLGRAGHRVLAAPGPAEALKMSREHDGPINLLITDMIMPEMRGNELADRLKASRKGLRVLFVTGYAEQAVPREGEYLRKPFSVADLLARVQALLVRRSPRKPRAIG